jgi:putative adenylate-forming enzyme
MFFKIKILYYFIKIKFERIFQLHYSKWYKKIKIFFFLKKLSESSFYSFLNIKKTRFIDIPIINKSIFMKNFDSINTCGITINQANEIALYSEKSRDFSSMIGDVSVGLSSGTSGNRGIFLVNESERAKWVAYILDRVISLGFKRQKIAFFLRANNELYESAKSKFISFNFFDIYIPFDNHLKRLDDLCPSILIAQPSILILLAKKKEINKLNISPKKIVSVAEVLTKEDKEYLQNVFNCKISEVYQCTEGFLANSCSEGYLHFNEDFLVIEKKYINNEKSKFHPIITDLLRESQPVVRYELNDIITEKKNCKCGSKFLAIEKIEGRSDDILILLNSKGESVSIFPDIIRRTIILSDSRIIDYAFIQNDNVFKLYIESSCDESFLKAKNALVKRFSEYNCNNFEIVQISTNKHKIGYKKRRVINENI